MNHLIMWSGGLTSTHYVLNLCKQTNEPIYAIYVYDDNVLYSKKQKAHIKALKNRIETITGHNIMLREYQIDANGEPASLDEKAMLAISYAYGLTDTTLHYHFESPTINQICQASKIIPSEQSEQPSTEHLQKHFNSLYWLTWNCQQSNNKKGCGQCEGCRRYQTIQK